MAVKSVATKDELLSVLQAPGYQTRSEDDIRTIAENLYRQQRDSAALQAKQSYEANAAALESQRAGIDTNYDRQVREQQEANKKSVASLDRSMIGRGMQRSSYNFATQANLMSKGNQALGDIEQNRTNALGSLDSQQTQLQRQLQQNLGAAESAYQSSVINKMQELMDQDYSRQQQGIASNNDLALKLYELMKGSTGSASGGSYGGGGVSSDGAKYGGLSTGSVGSGLDPLLESLLGGSKTEEKKPTTAGSSGGSQKRQTTNLVR